MRSDTSELGFTLVEVLVAFAIVAFSLGVLTSVMSSSATATSGLEARRLAVLFAQSKLAETAPSDPDEPEVVRGNGHGHFAWEIVFTPYGTKTDREAWPMAAYTAKVIVSYPYRAGIASVALETLKLQTSR